MADTLTAAFNMQKDRVVFHEEDRDILLRDHVADVFSLASALSERGVVPSDRVAVMADTSQAYIALWHAAMLGFFTIVPINVRLAAPEIREILKSAAPRILLCDAAHLEIARQVVPGTSEPVLVADLLAATGSPSVVRRDIDENEIPVIVYTGGTTGHAKGVMLTQKGLGVLVHRLHFLWDMFASDTCLYTTTPLFHVSGINNVLGPVLTGNRLVIVPRFDVARLVADVPRYNVTHLVMIAVMIDRLLDAIKDNPSHYACLKYIAYGGAPISRRTLGKLNKTLPNVKMQQCYGMTEALGSVTLLNGQDHNNGGARLASAGRMLPGCEIEVRSATGETLRDGEAGELFIRLDTLMTGYWNEPNATSEVLSDGWYRSGDIGYFDDGGYLFLVDRAKDMIVTGGENVYSVEVERAIEKSADVAQVAVIGIPSKEWGEQVHAIIVPLKGHQLDLDQLRSRLRGELAGYKCPKSIEMRSDPLPLSGNNKIVKAELRKPFWSGTTREIN